MPYYELKVTIGYGAKRDDSGDRNAAILLAIEDIPGVSWVNEIEVEEVYDVPTQPDESGS